MSNPVEIVNNTIHATVDTLQAVRGNVRSSIAGTLKGVLPAPVNSVVDTVVKADEQFSEDASTMIKQVSTTITGGIGSLVGLNRDDKQA